MSSWEGKAMFRFRDGTAGEAFPRPTHKSVPLKATLTILSSIESAYLLSDICNYLCSIQAIDCFLISETSLLLSLTIPLGD